MSEFKATEEQAAFIAEPVGGVNLGQALAGTGKTETAVQRAIRHAAKRFRFIVFNQANAKEMKERLPSNTEGSTKHSFMLRMHKYRTPRATLKEFKVAGIVTRDPEYNFYKKGMEKDKRTIIKSRANGVIELVKHLKNFSVHPDEEDALMLMDHHAIETPDLNETCVQKALEVLNISDNERQSFDYEDMVRFPCVDDVFKFDFDELVIDEVQDNNGITTHIMQRAREAGLSITGIGDENQAINGFAGSNCDSINKIIELLNPKIFPLTVNFRCSRRVIEEAQKIVPAIKAWSGACEGSVYNIESDKFISEEFKPGDCAISRKNRIIIPMCFRLIREGKNCTIQGRDFAEKFKKTIEGFESANPNELRRDIEKWYNKETEKKKSENQLDALQEKYETLKFFADQGQSMSEIYALINKIFSDKSSEYKLSTGHKAKGLQWPNVFILDAAKFKMSLPGMRPWQYKQESNLLYVAQTRPQVNLVYVN